MKKSIVERINWLNKEKNNVSKKRYLYGFSGCENCPFNVQNESFLHGGSWHCSKLDKEIYSYSSRGGSVSYMKEKDGLKRLPSCNLDYKSVQKEYQKTLREKANEYLEDLEEDIKMFVIEMENAFNEITSEEDFQERLQKAYETFCKNEREYTLEELNRMDNQVRNR